MGRTDWRGQRNVKEEGGEGKEVWGKREEVKRCGERGKTDNKREGLMEGRRVGGNRRKIRERD